MKGARHVVWSVALLVLVGCNAQETRMTAAAVPAIEHLTVYREAGRYAASAANHGIWVWHTPDAPPLPPGERAGVRGDGVSGDEILVGFSAGYVKRADPARPPVDRTRPQEHLLARSLDGGQTWKVERPLELRPPPEPGHMSGVPTDKGSPLSPLREPIDFTHPDLALTLRMGDNHTGPSWFFSSTNRGRQWQGPFTLPDFGLPAVIARTDYIVNGPHDLLAFLTSAKPNRREGRPFAARTTDGGLTWRFVGWIAPEPDGFTIMPSTVRLSDHSLLSAVRRREGDRNWIESYRSLDDGQTWEELRTVVSDAGREGNPASLIRLRDGRLAVTYGFRDRPYGIRARVSNNEGRRWGPEIDLRADGADWDVGYPRSVQRSDGRIVTIYHFNDEPEGDRYIGATIWDPGPSPGVLSR